MRHEFHPEAALEFEQAVHFYQERRKDLGQRFTVETRAAIQKILVHPNRWKIVEGDVRRCLVRVFPYSVLYTIEDHYILIVAITHEKRRPGYWRDRVLNF